jgi:DNA polymerase-3 subunit gamma/tau
VLEDVMQAVSQGSSDTVLQQVDKLISEGHSPVHFARQLVRFLRNAVVAKVAGSDSALLQISTDERQRVARVAELFSEEDLTRHLQIMLRTHGELGYRQEQRFHLELGLLKMAHAQRLLPIEQLLSEAGMQAPARPAGKPAIVPDPKRVEAPARSGPTPPAVSPFAADSARKSGSKPEMSAESSVSTGPRLVSSPTPVVMGAAAPAEVAPPMPAAAPEESATEDAESTGETEKPSLDRLREPVLNALSGAGHRMLVSMLEAGEWRLEGNELGIKVAASEVGIEMSLGAEARRLAIATASGVLGGAVKLKVVPGAQPANGGPVRVASNGGGRSRAEQDPIVRRMQEKFGAEVRTIIDYREKR